MTEEVVGLITIALGVVGVAFICLLGWLLVWGLLRAGTLRPAVALIISLSLLTMVALVGFAVTQTTGEQSTELATLAGTGLGALAGAVTAVWSDKEATTDPPVIVAQPAVEEATVTDYVDEWIEENPPAVEAVEAAVTDGSADRAAGWTPTLADDAQEADDDDEGA